MHALVQKLACRRRSFDRHQLAPDAWLIGALAPVWFLVAAVVAHVLGAVKHLVMDNDGVFQRMWFTQR